MNREMPPASPILIGDVALSPGNVQTIEQGFADSPAKFGLPHLTVST